MYNYCLSGIQKNSCNKSHLLENNKDNIDYNNINGFDSNYIENFEAVAVKDSKSDKLEVPIGKQIKSDKPEVPIGKQIKSNESQLVGPTPSPPVSTLFGIIPLGEMKKKSVEMPPLPKLGFFYAEIKDDKIDNLLHWVILDDATMPYLLNLKPIIENGNEEKIKKYFQSDLMLALKKYKTFLDDYGTINIKINKENLIKFLKRYPELLPEFKEDLINLELFIGLVKIFSTLPSLIFNIIGLFIINFDLPKINKSFNNLEKGPERIITSEKEFKDIKFIQILIPKILFVKEKNLVFLNFIIKEFMPKIGKFNEKQTKSNSEEFDSFSEQIIKFLDFIGKNILNDNIKLINFINYLFHKMKSILDFSVKLQKELDKEKQMIIGLDFVIDLITEFINFIPSDKCYFTEESNIISLEPNSCDSLQKSNLVKSTNSCPPIPEQKICPPIPEQKVCPPIPEQKECPPIPVQKECPPIPVQKECPPIPEQKKCPPIPEKDNSFFYLSGGLGIICVILILTLLLKK